MLLLLTPPPSWRCGQAVSEACVYDSYPGASSKAPLSRNMSGERVDLAEMDKAERDKNWGHLGCEKIWDTCEQAKRDGYE